MKKSIKSIISFILLTILVLSFSSCSIFEAMKQNALEASKITIHATPEEAEVISQFNKILELSKKEAKEITENISYSASTPDVLKDGEEAGILDSAAGQLKSFIMSANPGSETNVIDAAASDTLLNAIDESFVLDFNFSRNMTTETVTDEKGNEAHDEEGNVITEEKISDNILHLTIEYFDETALDGTEYATEENGEPAEETTVVYSDVATIESVFGSLKEKEAVLKNFENVKDYIVVSDYSVEYTDCSVTSDLDLDAQNVSYVNFRKNMVVTAEVEGVGSLAEYGKLQVVFNLTQNVNYTFSYEELEEEEIDSTEETTEAAIEETSTEVIEEASTEAAASDTAETIVEAESETEEASEETTAAE